MSEYLVEGDIQQIDAHSVPKFDILTAGFPCQTFSSVGLLQGFNDPRGNLFFETARIIHAVRPQVVFLESVANLIKHDDGKTFDVICQPLAELNYHMTYKVMNAKEYGNLPQQRNRIYIVAFRNKKYLSKFQFPEPIPLTQTAFDLFDKDRQDNKYYMDGHRMWDRMMEYMDDRNRVYRFTDWGLSRGMEGICPTLLAAMGSRFERIPFFYDDYSVRLITPREAARLQGFPESFILPSGEKATEYIGKPDNGFLEFVRKNDGPLTEHAAPKNGEHLIRLMQALGDGQSKDDLPEELRPKSGYPNTYAKLWWDRPSTTVTRNFACPSSSRGIHPRDSRVMSIREGARLQSFPDDYKFYGSDGMKRLEIGNAVPPLLSEAIAKQML